MNKALRNALLACQAAGLLLAAGCLASQDDLTLLQERVIRVETRMDGLEQENRKAWDDFAAEWTRRLASLGEDLRQQRERVAGAEGAIQAINEQLRRESDRAERFRSETAQQLGDFQRALETRLEMVAESIEARRRESEIQAGLLAANAAGVKALQAALAGEQDKQALFAAKVEALEAALGDQGVRTGEKLSVLIEEVSKENEHLREIITAQAEKLTGLEKTAGELAARVRALEQKDN